MINKEQRNYKSLQETPQGFEADGARLARLSAIGAADDILEHLVLFETIHRKSTKCILFTKKRNQYKCNDQNLIKRQAIQFFNC